MLDVRHMIQRTALEVLPYFRSRYEKSVAQEP
jgi:hypothetical protein